MVENRQDRMVIVETKHVFKTYKMGLVEVPALQDVSLSIDRGMFIAVSGPSGCGKSTLLNLIGCVDIATEGRVLFEGNDTSLIPDGALSDIRYAKVGFIFQTFNLIPTLNVVENILMGVSVGPRNMREPEEVYDVRVGRLLEELGLKGWEKHRPAELSGGQRQRVAIARALIKEPLLVLADEPTANLDSKVGKEIVSLMKQLNMEYGTTFVFATHDEQIMELANQHIQLHDGRMVY